MKITQEQESILNSLTCERLSENDNNLRAVESFSNWRNENLAETLKDTAFQEDAEGNIAYYVVKHPNGNILFYH